MKIERLMTNLCTQDIEKSTSFYISLFAFDIGYESDWFVHLVSEGKQLELGIISDAHEIMPEKARGRASGHYLTFVVENVDVLFQKAQSLNYEILQEPENTFYGQRRALIVAPEGTVCDISSLI